MKDSQNLSISPPIVFGLFLAMSALFARVALAAAGLPSAATHWQFWLLAVAPPLAGAAGLYAYRRDQSARQRERRSRTGCCQGCGYDLRATPSQCPECGTIPT